MKRIKKISGTSVLNGNVIDSLNDNSSSNAPSQRAINEALKYLPKMKVLWEGDLTLTTSTKTITTTEPMTDYDFIMFARMNVSQNVAISVASATMYPTNVRTSWTDTENFATYGFEVTNANTTTPSVGNCKGLMSYADGSVAWYTQDGTWGNLIKIIGIKLPATE